MDLIVKTGIAEAISTLGALKGNRDAIAETIEKSRGRDRRADPLLPQVLVPRTGGARSEPGVPESQGEEIVLRNP